MRGSRRLFLQQKAMKTRVKSVFEPVDSDSLRHFLEDGWHGPQVDTPQFDPRLNPVSPFAILCGEAINPRIHSSG
jgi:hypothetical protein